jgi:hypothetical protein
MAMDPTIKRSLVSTIWVAAQTGVGARGDPTFGAPASRPARVEYTPKRIIGANGEEVTSNGQVVTQTAILLSDRVWLPGTDHTAANDSVVPIRVDNALDEKGGVSHYQAYFA